MLKYLSFPENQEVRTFCFDTTETQGLFLLELENTKAKGLRKHVGHYTVNNMMQREP